MNGGGVCPICGYNNGFEMSQGNSLAQGDFSVSVPDACYTNNVQAYQPSVPRPQKKRKINKKALIAIITALTIAIAGFVVYKILSGRPKKVNLDKYVEIEMVGGYNGYGKVQYSFKKNEFQKAYKDIDYTDEYIKKIKKSKGDYANQYLSSYPAVEALASCLTGYFDKDSRLSNGDVVHFTWGVDKDELEDIFNIKLNYSAIEYTVEGLMDVETFDPFENIEVTFSGVEPDGTVNYEVVGDGANTSGLQYHFDKSSGLKSGDTVTLDILNGQSQDEVIDYCLSKFNKAPECFEKQYTAEVGKYIDSASEIDKEAMDAMDKQAQDVFNAHVISDWDDPNTFLGMTLIGNYFLKSKFEGEIRNKLFLIYRIEIKTDAYWEDSVEYYYYTEFENITVDSNKKCSVDLSEYKTPIKNGWFSDGHEFELGAHDQAGYELLSEIYDGFVAGSVDEYEYEDNIEDLNNGKLISESTPIEALIGKEMSFNGHRYKLVHCKRIKWKDAKTMCENEGGHLVTITSKEEQDFIMKLCGYGSNKKFVWIGLYRSDEKSDSDVDKNEYLYKWVTGEPVEYEYWSETNGPYVLISNPNYLWDAPFSSFEYSDYYICEWDD